VDFDWLSKAKKIALVWILKASFLKKDEQLKKRIFKKRTKIKKKLKNCQKHNFMIGRKAIIFLLIPFTL